LEKSVLLFALFFSASYSVAANAQQDVRGVRLQSDATRIFEEKCLGCHNRKLIDEAVKNRRNMEQVLRDMEKKGVVLTDKEKRVIGHFQGQKMFKEEEQKELRNK